MAIILIPNGHQRRVALGLLQGAALGEGALATHRIALAGILHDGNGDIAHLIPSEHIEPCLFGTLDRAGCIVGFDLLGPGYRMLQNYRPRAVLAVYGERTWDVAALLTERLGDACPTLEDLSRWNLPRAVTDRTGPDGRAPPPHEARLHQELSVLKDLAGLVERRGWLECRTRTDGTERRYRIALPRPRDFYSPPS